MSYENTHTHTHIKQSIKVDTWHRQIAQCVSSFVVRSTAALMGDPVDAGILYDKPAASCKTVKERPCT